MACSAPRHLPAVRPSTALITAIVNQKGGVGKTTTAFNLGVGLHRLGKRVLLVDLDPQAALTVSAGISLPHVTVSIYQALLDDDVDPVPIIRGTTSGVDVLPATLDLAAAEVELVNMTLRELVLKDVLAKLQPRVRPYPDRLPTEPGTPDHQRAGGGPPGHHSAPVRVPGDPWSEPAAQDPHQDPGPAQPRAEGRWHLANDVRRPDDQRQRDPDRAASPASPARSTTW